MTVKPYYRNLIDPLGLVSEKFLLEWKKKNKQKDLRIKENNMRIADSILSDKFTHNFSNS